MTGWMDEQTNNDYITALFLKLRDNNAPFFHYSSVTIHSKALLRIK